MQKTKKGALRDKLAVLVRLARHFFSLVKGFGIIPAARIDIVQYFKGVQYKHQYILDYLKAHFSDAIAQYRDERQVGGSISDDSIIWVCWFQGEENMPQVVRYCYESMKRYSGSYMVQLITLENYVRFVSLPQYIVNKVNVGQIPLTHFSDIIRCNLLKNYGGVYIDASLLLTHEIQIPRLPFYSIKLKRQNENHMYVSNYKWLAGFMAGVKGNVLHSFLVDFFNAYFERESELIDYFLPDYAIALAYETIPAVRKMVDDVPVSNEDFYYIREHLFQPINKRVLSQVLEKTHIFYIGRKGFPKDIPEQSLYRFLFD